MVPAGSIRRGSLRPALGSIALAVTFAFGSPLGAAPAPEAALDANKAHEKVLLENRFPLATACRTCHPSHFDEWSVSQHAYAQLSPVFNAMQGTIQKLTNGTNGDWRSC